MALAALVSLAACVPTPAPPADKAQAPGAPPLKPVTLATLPGWASDDTAQALATFILSCKTIALMPPDQTLGGAGYAAQAGGQALLWQNACNGARDVSPLTAATAQTFFETYFDAYQIDQPSRITGYFEPEFTGAKNLLPGYTTPLYAKPADPALAALPRAAIDQGALYRATPVTAYLADPVDAFMLQIQGSGRIDLPNGNVLRVGYDGQNGQPYTAIGSILRANGALAPGNVNYQSISQWLKDHPDQAPGIMEQNARYVYLRPLGPLPFDEGAPGALNVPVTTGRTLAVDRAAIPLGAPVFLATTDPITGAPINRLTIAQDTGGGIHGTDADLFFGAGPTAEATAGHMQQPGALYLLLPRPPASPTT